MELIYISYLSLILLKLYPKGQKNGPRPSFCSFSLAIMLFMVFLAVLDKKNTILCKLIIFIIFYYFLLFFIIIYFFFFIKLNFFSLFFVKFSVFLKSCRIAINFVGGQKKLTFLGSFFLGLLPLKQAKKHVFSALFENFPIGGTLPLHYRTKKRNF